MRVMGLDHATSSGVAIIENGEIIYTERFELIEKGNARLCEFKDRISGLLDEFQPEVIALEKPAHLRNAEILRYLIGLYSLALEDATRRNIDIRCVNPTTMKKWLTGDGRADKEHVAKALQERTGNDFREYIFYKKDPMRVKEVKYDVCDALSLALYVYNN